MKPLDFISRCMSTRFKQGRLTNYLTLDENFDREIGPYSIRGEIKIDDTIIGVFVAMMIIDEQEYQATAIWNRDRNSMTSRWVNKPPKDDLVMFALLANDILKFEEIYGVQ